MSSRAQRALLGAQGWLAVAAMLAGVAAVYLVFLARPGDRPQGPELLPAAACANGNRAGKLARAYRTDLFVLRYTDADHDCNAVLSKTAQGLGGVLAEAARKVHGFGMTPVLTPVEVALMSAPRGGPVQSFPAPGARGALILDPGTPDSPLLALRGYSELSLAESAPGLSARSRRRLGYAMALLVAGDRGRVRASVSALREQRAPDAATGMYEAWLIARFGPRVLSAGLASCRRACSWARARDRALRVLDADPVALQRAFLDRASLPAGRATLRRALRAR